MVNHLKKAVFYSASDEICVKTKMDEIFVYRPIYLTAAHYYCVCVFAKSLFTGPPKFSDKRGFFLAEVFVLI